MVSWLALVAGLAALAWLYLLVGHGRFWLCSERLPAGPTPDIEVWPAVAAVVPARNEEETVAAVIASLLAQDYPGRLSVTLVDDRSTDATRAQAEAVAAGNTGLTILGGEPLPAGW